MKETARMGDPSVSNCTGNTYQYTLQQPRTYTYSAGSILGTIANTNNCTAAYPNEWNRGGGMCPKVTVTPTPRFTCLTAHNSWVGNTSLAGGFAQYGNPCTYGNLKIDGQYYNGSTVTPALTNLGNTCISTIFIG
jgi:hypothetical protein